MGVNNEGFWDYHQMALQLEDAVDVLSVKYPDYDFVVLMDQSSDHKKKREGGLDAKTMNMKWGSKGIRMRDTVVSENGQYTTTHLTGQPQSLYFKSTDNGHFYLS